MIRVALLLLLALASFSTRAAELPNLGAEDTGLSHNEEAALGAEAMRMITRDPRYFVAPPLDRYLDRLGKKLAGDNLSIFVIRDHTINAFALPGGYIGVHTGLIELTQTESELAAVLAHEIAHVKQRHIARLVESEKNATLPTLAALAIALLAARSNPQMAQAAVATATAVNLQRQLDFTRDNEQEADRVGITLLEKADFEPYAMVRFFQRMLRSQGYDEGNAPIYLRTHPLTYQRIADMQNRVAELPYRQIADNLTFQLLRARLKAEVKDPGDAVHAARAAIDQERYVDHDAAWFGYAEALYRARKWPQAEEALAQINRQEHPLVAQLKAETALAQGNKEKGLAIYRAALTRAPHDPNLAEGYSQALIASGDISTAVSLLEKAAANLPEDGYLQEDLARAYARQGNRQGQYLAHAESLARQGDLRGAIQQLEEARKAPGGNFYDLSIIDARLRELKAKLPPKTEKNHP